MSTGRGVVLLYEADACLMKSSMVLLGVFESRVIALNALNGDLENNGKNGLSEEDCKQLLEKGQTQGNEINYYFDSRELNEFGE